jgi:hypothetical protein
LRPAIAPAACFSSHQWQEDDLVHFFGIFGPGPLERGSADEAPAKANFFGGRRDAVIPSRAEEDACYLSGKGPEPDRQRQNDALFGQTSGGEPFCF